MYRIFNNITSLIVCLLVVFACGEKSQLNTPKIVVDSYGTFSAEGGKCEIGYVLENPFEYGILRASEEAEWISMLSCDDGIMSFTLERNTGKESRTAEIILTYPECNPLSVEITQECYDQSQGMPIEISAELLESEKVSARFIPLNNDETYYAGCIPYFDFNTDGEIFTSVILDSLQAMADREGLYLNAVIKDNVVTGESSKEFENLLPGTDYIVYAFELNPDGTHGVNVSYVTVTSAPFDFPDAGFDISLTDASQTTLSVRFAPTHSTMTYLCQIVSDKDYNEIYGGNNEKLMFEKIRECQSIIDFYTSYGMTIDFLEFCKSGEYSCVYENLLPETGYHVFAFGLDASGLALSPLSVKEFFTDKAEITDNCTFGISFTDIKSSSFDVVVIPTNKSTRYYAYIAESEILQYNTPEEVASLLIGMANESGINWADSPFIFSGDRTLDTYDNLGANLLTAETSYTVFVFGVNQYGERTTAVAYDECITGSVAQSDMTISFAVNNLKPSSADILYTPSSDEYYFYGCVKKSEYERFSSDEEFIDNIIETSKEEGTFVPVKGKKLHQLRGNYLRSETEYIVYAFGYEGGVTTNLFIQDFITPERIFSGASLDITYEVIDGDDVYAQDPEMNYSFKGRAAVIFKVEPLYGAASWFFSGFGNSKDYLQALDVEELLYSIQTNGQKNYNKPDVMYAVDWNTKICCAGFACDSDGNEGEPVILEIITPAKSN